ncbi:MAG: hypothetical protein Q9173_004792 [Seirophora scorigena]
MPKQYLNLSRVSGVGRCLLEADDYNSTPEKAPETPDVLFNPTVSAEGKTVVITGGGAPGIGCETAKAYAEAGAAHVAILGRTQKTLDETKSIINEQSPNTKVTTHMADVADEEAVGKAAMKLKGWHILILNSGILGHRRPITETKLADWWRVYELPAGIGPVSGVSAYASSKIAQIKLLDFLAAENPEVFVASVHPGVVETPMTRGLLEQYGDAIHERGGVPRDDVKLSAHFILWMTSPEAHFLRGRFVWANWDVEQLKTRAKEIEESPQMLTSNVLGWPYQPRE